MNRPPSPSPPTSKKAKTDETATPPTIPTDWFSPTTNSILAVAPMVGQCDLPFRLLTQSLGATVIYSEMLLAEEFAKTDNTGERYRRQAFGPKILPENKVNVQFASNDPAEFLEAGKKLRKRYLFV